MKIFLSDVDDLAVSTLVRPLAIAGFSCEKYVVSEKVSGIWPLHSVDEMGVVILGAGLGDFLKRNWIQHFREAGFSLPILVITEQENRDFLMSFYQAGMTDYVCVPVRTKELITRVNLLIRQTYPVEYARHVFRNDKFEFSRFPNRVMHDGKEIALTIKEFELACLLFRHIGQALSRVTIEEAIWPSSRNELSRTVDTHISRVRNKLDLKEENGYRLQQVYGYGYQLVHLESHKFTI